MTGHLPGTTPPGPGHATDASASNGESDGEMPAAFLGHGTPMNALERNRFTEAWRTFGAGVPRPRAILAISAHWYINATAVTSMPRPRTIHDFYGFPRELFQVNYPAPGDPDLAEEIAEVVKPTQVSLDDETWGLDHGAWSVLVHAFPKADVPVVQLAVNAGKSFSDHLALGAALAPLRKRGILIIASGNVVHNLGLVNWSTPDAGTDWNQRFDAEAAGMMTSEPSEIGRLAGHRDYRLAVPTPDHFIPLLYLAGLASAAGRPTAPLVEGFAYGSLSMDAYTLDADCGVMEGAGEAGTEIPAIPADETNI